MFSRVLSFAVCVGFVFFGCKKNEKPVVGGLGRPVVLTNASDMRVTPDGKYLLYLLDARKPPISGVPPEMMMGTLQAVPAEGGSIQTLGTQVSNGSGGYLLSADSRWVVYLSDFDVRRNSGTLQAWNLTSSSGTASVLGKNVSYVLLSPDSAYVAYVDDGILKLNHLNDGKSIDVAKQVSTSDFSKDSAWLFFKRKLDAGAGLWVMKTQGGAASKLADQVGDFVVSPDSRHVAFQKQSPTDPGTYDLFVAHAPAFSPRLVSRATSKFAFSNDSKWLVRTQGAKLAAASDAMNFLGDLYVGLATQGEDRKLGSKVQDFDISPDSANIAFLENYNLQLHQGRLTVAAIEAGQGFHKELAPKVKTVLWSPDGKWLAYQTIVSTEFGPSPDLYLLRMGDEKPNRLLPWVFGYGFDPKNGYLLIRANCTRGGDKGPPRSCDLMYKDLRSDQDTAPTRLVEGIFSFKMSEDGQRLLLSYARFDGDLFDVAIYDFPSKTLKTLDHRARIPAYLLGKSGDSAVYTIAEPTRAGVYSSNIPDILNQTELPATKN